MYSRKRQVRECTNAILVYDLNSSTLNVLKPKGISIQPRKDHAAAIYGKSNFKFYNNIYCQQQILIIMAYLQVIL